MVRPAPSVTFSGVAFRSARSPFVSPVGSVYYRSPVARTKGKPRRPPFARTHPANGAYCALSIAAGIFLAGCPTRYVSGSESNRCLRLRDAVLTPTPPVRLSHYLTPQFSVKLSSVKNFCRRKLNRDVVGGGVSGRHFRAGFPVP